VVIVVALVLGVDGGGTKTRAVALDEKGNIIGFGISGASDYDAVGMDQAKQNLEHAIVQACHSLTSLSDLNAIHLGLAGVVSNKDVQVVQQLLKDLSISPKTKLSISHDCKTALAGATGGEPGIVLISGTGSACFGRNANGEESLSGGWGYLFADVGSSFYLGQQAIVAILNAYDGRGEATSLSAPILEALKINDVMEIMHRIYHPRLDVNGIAALAPIVTERAEQDDVARSIILNGCEGLVKVVDSVVNKLQLQGEFPIVPVGGLAASDSIFSKTLVESLEVAFPTAKILKPLASPLAGAGVLALRECGVKVSKDTFIKMHNRLSRFL
jgi:N-acetylglucosamine kinase-like BadF-type ATPase